MLINLPVYGKVDIEMFRDKSILNDLFEKILYLKENDTNTYNKLFNKFNEEYKKGNIPNDIYEKIMDEFKKVEYKNLDINNFVNKFKISDLINNKNFKNLINKIKKDYEKGLINKEMYNNLINALEQRRKKEKIMFITAISIGMFFNVLFLGWIISFIAGHWNAIKWIFSHINEITFGIILIAVVVYHFVNFDPKEYGIEVPEKPRPNNKKKDNWNPPEIPDGVDDIIEQLMNR